MRHAYAIAHNHAYGDSDAYVHAYGDCHSNCHIHPDGDCNGDVDSDRHFDGDRHSDSHGNCDRAAADYTDATASTHTAASWLALFGLGELAITNSRVPR